MSLKTLFILMGLVSTSMIAAVIYTKILHPSYITVAETRAIDRLCQRQSDDIMSHWIKKKQLKKINPSSEQKFYKQIHGCLAQCRSYLIQSRSKGVKLGKQAPLHIPECLLDPDLKAMSEEKLKEKLKEEKLKEEKLKEKEQKAQQGNHALPVVSPSQKNTSPTSSQKHK